MSSDFTSRVEKVLDKKVLEYLQSKRFVVLGCGGVGANFAETLVRTGAKKLVLIDYDKVEKANLNRYFSEKDIGKNKVEALSDILRKINKDIEIKTHSYPVKLLRASDSVQQEIHDDIQNGNVCVVAMDKNEARINAEKSLNDYSYFISIVVQINSFDNYTYQVSWCLKTPQDMVDKEGYGEENGSLDSIVQEASSTAFSMMLNNLYSPENDRKEIKSIYREYKDNKFNQIIDFY